MDGDILRIGGKHLDSGHLDVLGIMTGSEGLLGVVTEVTVRIYESQQHSVLFWLALTQFRKVARPSVM